jgi:SHS2 domain-containing protein
MFEYLENTSDIKIRVKAKDDFEFYSDIVESVNDSIFSQKFKKEEKRRELVFESKSKDQLIHDFIDELVYIANFDHYKTRLSDADVDEKKNKFVLKCKLDLYKAKPEEYKVEVKAVSFNVIYKEDPKTNEKVCEFVLDI